MFTDGPVGPATLSVGDPRLAGVMARASAPARAATPSRAAYARMSMAEKIAVSKAAPAREKPLLLLLDGHSLAYRAFFALPVEKFSTTTGQPTNAVYGFTSMLINLLRDERPTHIGVAFDLSRQTWRSQEYVEYKANRTSSPADFKGQIELIKEVLAALRIPAMTAENYEADDIIATLTTRAVAAGVDTLICTGDRDAFQLVNDQVTVLYPKRGVSDMSRVDPDEMQNRYGLTAAQYPDFAALRGDPSDNLPNIPGVGEKTAAKWVRDFGSLMTLVDRIDEVPGKAGDALRANLTHVLQNRRLTELVRDVPIEIDPVVDLHTAPFDREAVHSIFDNLQFKVLRERLLETFEQADETSTEGFDISGRRLPTGSVAGWLDAHTRELVGITVRGAWAPGGGDVQAMALAAADGAAALVAVEQLDEGDEQAFAGWLADPARPKVGHDLKPAVNALVARGWAVDGIESDTALAAYLALPGQRAFDLGDLVQRYLHRTLDSTASGESEQLSLDFEAEAPAADPEAERDQADMVQARAVIDLGSVAGPATRGVRAEVPTQGSGATGRAGTRSDGAHRHRRRRRLSRRLAVHFRRGGRRGGRPRLRRARAARSISGRRSSCRRCSSTS